jgi:hypothetical protein
LAGRFGLSGADGSGARRASHHHAPAASATTASAANAPRIIDGLFFAPPTGRFAAEVPFVFFSLLPFQAICRSLKSSGGTG